MKDNENSTFRRAADSDSEVFFRTKTNPGIYNNGQFQSLIKGSQVDITTDNINIEGLNIDQNVTPGIDIMGQQTFQASHLNSSSRVDHKIDNVHSHNNSTYGSPFISPSNTYHEISSIHCNNNSHDDSHSSLPHLTYRKRIHFHIQNTSIDYSESSLPSLNEHIENHIKDKDTNNNSFDNDSLYNLSHSTIYTKANVHDIYHDDKLENTDLNICFSPPSIR